MESKLRSAITKVQFEQKFTSGMVFIPEFVHVQGSIPNFLLEEGRQ